MQGYLESLIIAFFSGVSLPTSTVLMFNLQPLHDDILFTLVKTLHAYPVQF